MVVFIDNILIYLNTREEYAEHLRIVLGIVRGEKTLCQTIQMRVLVEGVKFLGNVLSQGRIFVDPSKVEVMMKQGRPTTVTEIRSFLGLARNYRRFIRGFSHIALPLTKLTRKNISFEWMVECERSFQELKDKLTTTLILVLPDLNRPFEVYCDASRRGLGCILMENWNVVAYASEQLKLHKVN